MPRSQTHVTWRCFPATQVEADRLVRRTKLIPEISTPQHPTRLRDCQDLESTMQLCVGMLTYENGAQPWWKRPALASSPSSQVEE